MDKSTKNTSVDKLFVCSIYDTRPDTCKGYPWNFANRMFKDCIFVDMENEKLRTMEEQLELNTKQEINDYCVQCGRCCFFGPAACSKLRVKEVPR